VDFNLVQFYNGENLTITLFVPYNSQIERLSIMNWVTMEVFCAALNKIAIYSSYTGMNC